MWKCKEPRISKIIFKNKRSLKTYAIFKTYYSFGKLDSMLLATNEKNISMEQIKELRAPRISFTHNSHLLFN